MLRLRPKSRTDTTPFPHDRPGGVVASVVDAPDGAADRCRGALTTRAEPALAAAPQAPPLHPGGRIGTRPGRGGRPAATVGEPASQSQLGDRQGPPALQDLEHPLEEVRGLGLALAGGRGQPHAALGGVHLGSHSDLVFAQEPAEGALAGLPDPHPAADELDVHLPGQDRGGQREVGGAAGALGAGIEDRPGRSGQQRDDQGQDREKGPCERRAVHGAPSPSLR